MKLSTFIDANSGPISPDRLLSAFVRFVGEFGAECVSYHITVSHLQRLNFDEGFILARFPADWIEHYRAQKYYDIDPIIGYASRAEGPFRWFEIGQFVTLTPAQVAYLEDLRAHGFLDGFGIPIFSANATAAYVGVGSRHAPLRLDETEILTIQYASQFIHNRYMQLFGADTSRPVALTPRELEVLSWLARGKSNSVIADILGISEHTVDTLVRRCYRKLGVTERVGAALKAVGLGLVVL